MTPVCGGLINGKEMKKYNSTELIEKANKSWENVSSKGICAKDYTMGYIQCYADLVHESNDIQNVRLSLPDAKMLSKIIKWYRKQIVKHGLPYRKKYREFCKQKESELLSNEA